MTAKPSPRTLWAIAASFAATGAAAQPSDPPLPPPRPHALDQAAQAPVPPARPAGLDAAPRPVLGPPMPPPGPSTPTVSPKPDVTPPPDQEAACVALFNSRKVVVRALPPILPTPEGCGVPAPVELSSIVLAGDRHVAIQPPVTVDCPLANAVADWVRDDLSTAFADGGSPLTALVDTGGYACRGRNRVAGAKLSEHAHGNAMDIGAFATADGRRYAVKTAAPALVARIKSTACGRFATVLGPGSDGFHENHMHVDLAARTRGFKLCHWDLTGPAAPSWNAARRGPL